MEQVDKHALRRFSRVLKEAREVEASDVHIIANLPPTFRVSGEILLEDNAEPWTPDEIISLKEALLTPLQKERLERERELSISYFHEESGRLRVSLYHRMGIPEMAVRMCNLSVKNREELMLPEILDHLAQRASGIIIITGPTGMGKTTTLNYMIDLINASRKTKIITIEDPVEFDHQHRKSIVTQIEVGTDTLDFAHCLRNVLRLDPDVICIGEMRDLETIETALTAADTGHLVLATLHTPSAAGTVERIVGSFDGERQPQVIMQLSATLLGVIAQRLVPTVDKTKRVLATEILLATEAARNLIRDSKMHQLHNVIETSRALGMRTMEESLAQLYRSGLITYNQAVIHANDVQSLDQLLRR